MAITANLNKDKSIIKIKNPCTGTFLLLNKEEAIDLRSDLNYLIGLMEME